jgi:hypothetical protein
MSQSHAAPPNEINDAWRGWIAENLILGAQPQALLGVMIQSGIVEHSARVELDAAMRSPYLRGAARMHNRVAKRDWVLGI